MKVRYLYWNRIRNCGDAITAYILRDVMNVTPVVGHRDSAHLLATGSILFMANAQSYVWGSGMLSPNVATGDLPSPNICAVRGKKTLEILRQDRSDLGEVPLGDPGVLVGYLRDRPDFAALPTRYRAAIVPHHESVESFATLVSRECCVVDMRDVSLRPLEMIQQSEVVVSQSLHGLIFAAALGKPYVWISHSAEPGWMFKFQDWFTTTDNPQTMPLAIDTPIDTLIARAQLRPHIIDIDALLAAFPTDEVQDPNPSPVVDFEVSRTMQVAVIRADWLDGLAALGSADVRLQRKFQRTLQRKILTYFAGWSEIPYVLVLPQAAPEPAIDHAALARLMDRHWRTNAAIILTKPEYPDGFEPGSALGERGIAVAPHPIYAEDAGLLLRPNAAFAFAREIYTFAAA